MEEDDMMPNDGTYFFPREPKDQVLSRKKEKAQTLEGLTVIQDLLKRWSEKIAYYESIRAIPEEVKLNETQFMHTVAGHAVVLEILETEKEYIEELISNYGPK